MSLDDDKRLFSANYYSWSKDQLEKEFQLDFPILKTVSSCKPVVEFFRKLSDRHQLVAISAFSKRAHTEVVGPLWDATTDEEAELLRNYLEFLRPAIARVRYDDFGEDFDRVAFTRNIEAQVGPILGHLVEKGGQFYRRYSREFDKFRIETTIHTGGRSAKLQYGHRLFAQEGLIREHISILSWLGITNGTTDWMRLNNSTSKSVVEAFTNACSTFIEAAPKLMAGRHEEG